MEAKIGGITLGTLAAILSLRRSRGALENYILYSQKMRRVLDTEKLRRRKQKLRDGDKWVLAHRH